jgi:D-3-phosphoglycerate dehydrogenase / 2-oxoglutarate reductase
VHIVVLGEIDPAGIDLLRRAPAARVSVVNPSDRQAVEAHVATADAVLVRTMVFNKHLVSLAGRLKVVSRYGVGVDNIDVGALSSRGIPVAVVGNENAVSVAEHTLYLILAAMKMGIAYDAATRNGNWKLRDAGLATDLNSKTIFIIGLGRIGFRVAELCEAFGMEVTFFDPNPTVLASAKRWRRATDLIAGLREADVVTVHTPLEASTRSLLGRAELAVMRKSAVIVSTCRGGVVEESSLATALANGDLRGAALDVFDEEPVAASNPLLKLQNVVLSPHMAALTREGVKRMSLAAAQNCLDGIEGRLDPQKVVNSAALVAPQSADT